MVFLLNKSRVLGEMVTLAKLKLADRLSISESDIDCSFELDGDVLRPKFSIPVKDGTVVTALERQIALDAITEVWRDVKPELEFRLKNVDQCRIVYV